MKYLLSALLFASSGLAQTAPVAPTFPPPGRLPTAPPSPDFPRVDAPIPFGLAREVTVAADGSGDFQTVQSAIDAAPEGAASLYLVHIRPGTYREKLVVPRTKGPMKFLGQDPKTTILTFSDHAKTLGADGKELGTSRSASTHVAAANFAAENVTFANDAGAVGQAVAFKLDGDRATFRNCRFTGWQDTLLLNRNRAYLENCFISGHVDFIFGASTAYFEGCEIQVRGTGYISAASTPETSAFGYVFSNCRITSDGPQDTFKTYLGRPWRPFGAVVWLNTEMASVVQSAGWDNWRNPENEKTARYSEWNSRGPGASNARVAWAKPLSAEQVAALTPEIVLDGWNPSALSQERIASLPKTERVAWESYLTRSQTLMDAERAQLKAETGGAKPKRAFAAKDFKLKPEWKDAWWKSDQAKTITDAMLSFQTPSGGWSKAVDYLSGARQKGMQWTSQNEPFHYAATIDNRATTEQIAFLNQIFAATGRSDVKTAIQRGLDYLFTAQYPSGGWPQTFPLEGGYHDAITFNDNANIHVLEVLSDAANAPEWSWIDAQRRQKAATAIDKAIECILRAQWVQNGVKTVWGAQHDPISLQPIVARLKEPASLSGGESMEIARFLMKQAAQPQPVVEAIEAALKWYEKSVITDLKPVVRDGKTTYETQTTPQPPLWARFYDLQTNQPIFAGAQDAVIYHSYAEMAARNTFSYDFFVYKPRDLLLKDQPKWRKKLVALK